MLSNTPFVVSEFVLVRLLKSMAGRLGLDDGMADAVAQVHLSQSTIIPAWSAFFESNCGRCRKSPETCDYLNPTQDQCRPGQSVQTIRAAVALMIESRRQRTCPALDPQEPQEP